VKIVLWFELPLICFFSDRCYIQYIDFEKACHVLEGRNFVKLALFLLILTTSY